ncbi:hypothetical protein C4D60_Mb09t02680 [Musa balbisiana]|uniref:Uncharacterized protein n=1 Tax=Musa balbisiana TaxID=52838 RepID=A0A4S8IDI9_MUSBA|nr:hypothetical protein C4D60_Mb09t02680 [Musa balbisiana]
METKVANTFTRPVITADMREASLPKPIHGGVKHDHVDAGELLEEGDEDGHGELSTVLPLHDVGPRVLHPVRLLAGSDQVVVLLIDVIGAADAAKHVLGLLGVAALDEGVGGVGQKEGAEADDASGDGGKREADAPPPPALDLSRAVVDEVGGEDADGDHELEPDIASKLSHQKTKIWYRKLPPRLTWLAKPTPMPRRMRPRMSMRTFLAAPLSAAPIRKTSPPPNMDHLRPNVLVTIDAKKEAINAARYSDDVKVVSSWLSNLQYWLVLFSDFSFLYTSGKNFSRNESIDVTPPTLHKSKSPLPRQIQTR